MSGSGVRRLMVVSNRLPLSLRATAEGWQQHQSSGGLATAMGPLLARSAGVWVGWPGDAPRAPDPERARLLADWHERRQYVAVELPRDVGRRFYEGYANQTLWPLFHQFPSRLALEARGFEAYREANLRFRDVVLEHVRDDDLVWVHDYHLLLLPQLLREARPELAVGFFLHIPFPSSDVFRVLPRREELLSGLLGADLIAFHTHGHLQNFRRSLLRVLGLESRMDRVETGDRFARLEALPIGIAPDAFAGALERRGGGVAARAELQLRFPGCRIVLAVDRLDYTKGIPERLRAFRLLLERNPALREKVVLVQIAVPSRERIPHYAELRQEVNELVGEINGALASPGWTPVVYIRRGIPRSDLVALYAAADVAWVTPLRDGMNLVAKEYVACQKDAAGVLVLSEFAGAAAEMGEALLVNPYDSERSAATLERALELPESERRERMAALYKRVLRNNVFAWAERFLRELETSAESRQHGPRHPDPLPGAELIAAWRGARRRVLLLDYDGTLVGFAPRPADALPPPELLEQLQRLAGRPGDLVAIVSGRPRQELDAWFAATPGLWIAAEHGALIRDPDAGQWQTLRPALPAEWKARVLPVLEHFVDRTPGSLVEEKEYALVWHYRMSDPEFGDWLANELTAVLDDMLAETELRAVRGQKSVEVRLAWAHKGEVVTRLLARAGGADFVAGFGDDRTDEDMFERLPPEAWTVHVGPGPSKARHWLPGPPDVRALLSKLADLGPGHEAAAASG